jgi:hypothetical protein
MIYWLATAAAAVGFNLAPFGSISSLTQAKNPWQGFHSEDPVLWVLRVQKVESGECKNWIQGLLDEVPQNSTEIKGEGDSSFTEAAKVWAPWDEDDLNAVTDCDDFPCAVKLDESEVKKLASIGSEQRQAKFFGLVQNRMAHYVKTQERKAYEFPGDPVDPWKLLEKKGYPSQKGTLSPSLWLRKLDFAPDKIRAIRQVLDVRKGKNSSGTEATVLIRDVYTDHYFDSWGEWTHVSCEGLKNKTIYVSQALIVELDLLKKTDLISKIMRGKMRGAIEENGYTYLENRFQKLKNRASSASTTPRK